MLILRQGKAPLPPEKVLQQYVGEQLVARFRNLRPSGKALAPLTASPEAEHLAVGDPAEEDSGRREEFGHGVCGHLMRASSMASAASCLGGFRCPTTCSSQSVLRLLLDIMGAPSSPSLPSLPSRCLYFPSREPSL
ncbi:hypothetical protein ACP4OV_006143 [Aristida adscensionis]